MTLVPASLETREMREVRQDAARRGYEVRYFTGDILTDSGAKRGAVDQQRKIIWIQADDDNATVRQIWAHEKYHTLPGAVKSTVAQRLLDKHGAEITRLAAEYVDLYGWTDMDMADVLEEVLADAYAGIDVFDFLTTQEGATRFTEEVREAVGAEAEGSAESGTRFSGKAERRSDRPERRRALEPGEMINEFRDKINWPAYYQKLNEAQYNSDNFEDGEIAVMRLGGHLLTMQMQSNGEFSIVGMEEENERLGQYGKSASAGNGRAEVSGKRGGYRDGSDTVQSGQGRGNRSESSELQNAEGSGQSGADVSLTDEQRKPTRRQDADYMAAVERGDTETAQRMVDLPATAWRGIMKPQRQRRA